MTTDVLLHAYKGTEVQTLSVPGSGTAHRKQFGDTLTLGVLKGEGRGGEQYPQGSLLEIE